MVTPDTVEGIINGTLWFHFDIGNDVLHVVVASQREVSSMSEETPEGIFVDRRESDDQIIGLTVINWWKRFGSGDLPDSLAEMSRQVEAWVEPHRLAVSP